MLVKGTLAAAYDPNHCRGGSESQYRKDGSNTIFVKDLGSKKSGAVFKKRSNELVIQL